MKFPRSFFTKIDSCASRLFSGIAQGWHVSSCTTTGQRSDVLCAYACVRRTRAYAAWCFLYYDESWNSSPPIGALREKTLKNDDWNLKKKLRKNISGQAWCTAKTQRFTVYHGQRPWCTVKTQRFTVHQERQKTYFSRFSSLFFLFFSGFFPRGKELCGIGGMGDGGTGWEMEEMRVRWRRGDGVGVLWSVVAPGPESICIDFQIKNSDINMKLS